MYKTRKILILDDQPEIGTLLGRYVVQLGCKPVVAESVDQAIDLFNDDDFLMVISDVVMPEKNGFQLARYIRDNHPQTQMAMISGFLDQEMENLIKGFGISKIYRKPILLDSVKEMIAFAIKEGRFTKGS